jgi:dTDP-4-dehydrorhamnose reductase
MRLLVVGAGGLLGSNVVETARGTDLAVAGTYHSTEPSFDVPLYQLDLQDTDTFETVVSDYDPDAVVNCAALTDVDGCETDPDAAMAINGNAPGELAAHCESIDVDFVHVSTDYVFDGTQSTPYTEDDQTNPRQEYGRSKLAGEQAVRANHSAPLIARLSFVYGVHGATGELTGFPAWVAGRLESGEATALFTDQYVTPSRAGQVASVLLDCLDRGLDGTYHVASRTCTTPYEFGDKIRARVDAPASVLESGSMSALDRPATRPAYSCLDCTALETELGTSQPTLEDDLAAIAESLD